MKISNFSLFTLTTVSSAFLPERLYGRTYVDNYQARARALQVCNQRCQRHPKQVDLEFIRISMGYSSQFRVRTPEHRGKFIDIGACGGICHAPSSITAGSLHVNENTETTCVPTRFKPLVLQVADDNGYFNEITIENGIIEQCSCVTISKMNC
ncbi:Oidioi.mRNA.OKI2018_I69.chr1.g1017.t1.cds [Oikopleura dioica]|uniref:Oidioi.mRNA.OKI2018_I69.chr1.g1017.t1.cds n=1 Tax=Oikopleura dioica TaxID=34765 RepID=A0ABN7STS6_OIKDI|nr:Oidioi.mRNA.OKI2018_I69.chr1.g1017.t1.cds [Oikopleura dioica]